MLGRELAITRVQSDISASELARRLEVPVATVIDVETGWTQVSSALLNRWCDIVKASAPDVLARAARMAPSGEHGLLIDLRPIVEAPINDRTWRTLLVEWARNTISLTQSTHIVVLEETIDELALSWDVSKDLLVSVLRDYVPLGGDSASD
jgi:transcriptional regulator with XRE-family HTH domain